MDRLPDTRTMLNEVKSFLNEAQIDTLVKKFAKIIKGYTKQGHRGKSSIDAMLYSLEKEANKAKFDVELDNGGTGGFINYFSGEHDDGSAFEHNGGEEFITIVYPDGDTKEMNITTARLK